MSEKLFSTKRLLPVVAAASLLFGACSDDEKSPADVLKDKNTKVSDLEQERAKIAADKARAEEDLEAAEVAVVVDCLPDAKTAVQNATNNQMSGADSAEEIASVFDALNGEEGETAGQDAVAACVLGQAGVEIDFNVDTSGSFVNGVLTANVELGQ